MRIVLLELPEIRLRRPRTVANVLIYGSIVLGVALLAQLYSTVPLWLFFSVLAGWIGYLVVGIGVAERVSAAYPASIALAVLTLLVSLPQPEHYSLGVSLASATFIAGTVLQIAVIFSVVRYLILKRRLSVTFPSK